MTTLKSIRHSISKIDQRFVEKLAEQKGQSFAIAGKATPTQNRELSHVLDVYSIQNMKLIVMILIVGRL